MDKKTTEQWFKDAIDGIADDAKKAEVLKALIEAEAATEQNALKERGNTERAVVQDDDYQAYKTGRYALVALLIVLLAIVAGVTANSMSEHRKDIILQKGSAALASDAGRCR